MNVEELILITIFIERDYLKTAGKNSKNIIKNGVYFHKIVYFGKMV
jgi:hypothetical protein